MTHLTVEEIIEFISFDELSEDTLMLSAKVNSHIRHCSHCLNKVKSYQMVYDELCKISSADLKQQIYCMVDDGYLNDVTKKELEEIIHSFNESGMNNILR